MRSRLRRLDLLRVGQSSGVPGRHQRQASTPRNGEEEDRGPGEDPEGGGGNRTPSAWEPATPEATRAAPRPPTCVAAPARPDRQHRRGRAGAEKEKCARERIVDPERAEEQEERDSPDEPAAGGRVRDATPGDLVWSDLSSAIGEALDAHLRGAVCAAEHAVAGLDAVPDHAASHNACRSARAPGSHTRAGATTARRRDPALEPVGYVNPSVMLLGRTR